MEEEHEQRPDEGGGPDGGGRACPACALPDELTAAILSWLHWRCCLSLRAVSRTWLRHCDDDRVWVRLIRQEWDVQVAVDAMPVRPQEYFRRRKMSEVEVVLRGQALNRYHEVMVRVPRQGTVENVRVAAEAAIRSRGGGTVNADTSRFTLALRQSARPNDYLDPWRSLQSAGITRNGHSLFFDAISTSRLSLNV